MGRPPATSHSKSAAQLHQPEGASARASPKKLEGNVSSAESLSGRQHNTLRGHIERASNWNGRAVQQKGGGESKSQWDSLRRCFSSP